MKDSDVYLRQILDAVSKIETFVSGYSENEFRVDAKTQSAVIMQLTLIGEISKRLDEDTKRRIELPWKDIAGFRDRAIHNYFEIDLAIVWETVTGDLPLLKRVITEVL